MRVRVPPLAHDAAGWKPADREPRDGRSEMSACGCINRAGAQARNWPTARIDRKSNRFATRISLRKRNQLENQLEKGEQHGGGVGRSRRSVAGEPANRIVSVNSEPTNVPDNAEGSFPSGQRGQTVNLMALPSQVRILHSPLTHDPHLRTQLPSAEHDAHLGVMIGARPTVRAGRHRDEKNFAKRKNRRENRQKSRVRV